MRITDAQTFTPEQLAREIDRTGAGAYRVGEGEGGYLQWPDGWFTFVDDLVFDVAVRRGLLVELPADRNRFVGLVRPGHRPSRQTVVTPSGRPWSSAPVPEVNRAPSN